MNTTTTTTNIPKKPTNEPTKMMTTMSSNFAVSSSSKIKRIRRLRVAKILGTLLFFMIICRSYTVFFPKMALLLDAATWEEEMMPTIQQQQRRQGGENNDGSSNSSSTRSTSRMENPTTTIGIRSKNVTLGTNIRNNNNNNRHASSSSSSSFIPLPNSQVILYNNRGNDDNVDDNSNGNKNKNITNTQQQEQQQCQIGSNWKFLDSGGSAFTFRVDLACWDKNNVHKNNNNMIARDDISITDIVVRLQSQSENNATTNKLDRYIQSASERKNEELIHFYRQLQGNWTTQEFEDHFVAQIGTVQVPCDFLQNTQNVPLRDTELVGVHWSTDCGSDGNATTFIVPTITAQLYNFAPGIKMDFEVVDALSTTRRSQIVKNLIFKFRHMYQQQVMHCNLTANHILLEEQEKTKKSNGDDNIGDGEKDVMIIKTRMIDFERHRSVAQISVASKKRHFQRNQLWQLLYMIGFVCGYRSDNFPRNPPKIHTGSCRMKPLYPIPEMKEVLPFMEQCEFEKGRPLKWNSDYLTRDTSGAYDTLATWAGIIGETSPSSIVTTTTAATSTSTRSSSSSSSSMVKTNNKPSFIPIPNSEVILYDRGNDNDINATDSTIQCQIGSNWEFLDFGGSAFTFRADVACWLKTTTTPAHMNKTANITSSDGVFISDIAVRLQASRQQNDTAKTIDRYIRSSGGRDQKAIDFFRQLQGDWTTQQFDDHFVAQIGMVQISCDFLQNMNKLSLRDNIRLVGVHRSTDCYQKRGNATSTFIPTIVGELYNYAPGEKLTPKVVEVLSATRRAQLAKDIIVKTRHMYEQQVIHCDFNPYHILLQEIHHDTSGTNKDDTTIKARMIDFERRRNLVDEPKKSYFQQSQLYQLLHMVAFFCGKNIQNQEASPPEVDSVVCQLEKPYPMPNMTEWLPLMKQCEFEQPLEWNSDDLLRDTPRAYDTLARWVGISEPSHKIATTASTSSSTSSMVKTKKPSFIPIPNSKVILYDRGRADDENPNSTNTTLQCQIGSNWDFLGSGGSAFAFRADVACWSTTTAAHNNITSDDNVFMSDIVVRLKTSREENATTHTTDRYIMSSGGRDQNAIDFFRQLQGSWTAQQFDDHFVAQIGMVQISCGFLQNMNTLSLNGNAKYVGVHRSSDCYRRGSDNSPFPTIVGELYNYAPGKKLTRGSLAAFSKKRRAQIAKAIIVEIRHMYEQQVIHCDLTPPHILLQEVQPNARGINEDDTAIKARMIDFERRRNLVGEPTRSYFQRNQLYQLLHMVAYICGQEKEARPPEVHSVVCHPRKPYPMPNMTELLPFMKQCEFERPLEWNSDELLRDTVPAYDKLATWAGINENSIKTTTLAASTSSSTSSMVNMKEH